MSFDAIRYDDQSPRLGTPVRLFIRPAYAFITICKEGEREREREREREIAACICDSVNGGELCSFRCVGASNQFGYVEVHNLVSLELCLGRCFDRSIV